MSTTGKEYRLAIRIAGIIDKSFTTSLAAANTSLRTTLFAVNNDFTVLDKGFNKVMNLGKSCFRTIATAAGVATLAIGATAVAATKVGSEFEAQMSTVQAISQATNEEMSLLSSKARELAQSSVFSAKEVGNAMEYMGMAGWKTEEILAGIEGVLNLAAASGEDFSLVSDIVTDDLTAFNMTAGETQRMVDVMAQAAMNSNTNVELMGETFKYAGTVAGAMGYSIEDVAIATGLMASSAVKGSMAGTTLRNIMTRMAKPTKESAEAMEALGLSLEKSDGSMYSFMEIMQQIREGMSGMTKTQKAYYAAELGGQRGMTGLLAIANASDKEFQKLTEAIYNAKDAAQKMAEIRLDNLSGDVEIFKDTLSDAGIELYYQFNDQLRDVVQFGTEAINSAKVNIPKAYREISAEFPTLQRKFKKYAEPVLDGVVDTGKWIVKNGKGIISVLSGVGAAMAAYKVASSGVHFITALMKLGSMNPVTLGILGVVAAIGAITGAIVAYKQHEAEMIDNNLTEHFGNIALSMEDIQQVAEHIVSSDSLNGVRKVLEAFEDVDIISSEIDSAIKRIDKMNWKVSIGMELSEEEQEEYKTAIDEYIKAAQEYAEQSQYAVSLNLGIAFDGTDLEGQTVVDKVNQFYQDKYDELSDLGAQLNQAVTDAFNDGLLDIKETKVIAEIQAQMAEIQKSLATGEFDAQLSILGMEYAGGVNLTSDSFQNLQEELANKVAEASAAYKESYAQNYASIQAAYEAGDYLTYSEYQTALDEIQKDYLQNVGDVQMKALNFQLQTIMEAYSEELDPAIDNYLKGIQDAMSKADSYDWEGDFNKSWSEFWPTVYGAYNAEELDKETRGAIQTLLDAMAPTMADIEELRQQYNDLGIEMSAAMAEGLYNYNLVSVLADNGKRYKTDGISDGIDGSYILGQEIGKAGLWDNFYDGLLSEARSSGYVVMYDYIKKGAADAAAGLAAEEIVAAEESVRPVIEGMYAWSQEIIDEYFSKGFTTEAELGITLNPSFKYDHRTLPGQLPSLNGIGHRANGGLATRPELTWFAENGPEMAIPIDGSRNAISLWEQTGRLLGMDSALDGLDIGGGGGPTIEYSPTLQFYGGTPSRDDLEDALRVSQDEFDSLMERYLKTHGRVAFG